MLIICRCVCASVQQAHSLQFQVPKLGFDAGFFLIRFALVFFMFFMLLPLEIHHLNPPFDGLA